MELEAKRALEKLSLKLTPIKKSKKLFPALIQEISSYNIWSTNLPKTHLPPTRKLCKKKLTQ